MSQPANFLKLLSPIALAIILSACGGSSGGEFGTSSTDTDTDTTDTTDTDTTDTDDDGVEDAEELIYSLQALEVGLTALSAGGSTGVTTRLFDQNDDLSQVEQSVSFTSTCISNGTSEIVSPVVSSNGVFTTTYTAIGCEGEDTITATIDGLSVEETLTVEAASLGQVEFVSTDPQNILLSGMSAAGLQHTSTVTFQILNDVGGPIADEDVAFELTTDVGGITLATTTGKTDNDGYVSVILEAGTVHTSVRVQATVVRDGETISSESSNIVISTGIADQNSFSLSLSSLNPSAWDYDGVEVSVYVIASDRYNNPVPDGTAVALYTEFGQISPSCTTVDGKCTGLWTSSDPRDLGINDIRYPHEGISTITAKIIGEESFVDTNSNGIFDDGDLLDTDSDKGEAFEDYNKNYDTDSLGSAMDKNSFDDGLEPYIDFNGNGVRDAKDGKYTGLGCAHTTLCAEDDGVKDIFVSAELVLAENTLNLVILDPSDQVVSVIQNDVLYRVYVYGATNKQVPPDDTTILASTDVATIIVGSSASPGSTNFHYSAMYDLTRGIEQQGPFGPFVYQLYLEDADPDEFETGYVEFEATTGDTGGGSLLIPYLDTAVTTP